jgi:hypothetical protein
MNTEKSLLSDSHAGKKLKLGVLKIKFVGHRLKRLHDGEGAEVDFAEPEPNVSA